MKYYACTKVYKGNGIKLEMSLRRESGIGRCISALTLCNVNLFRNETGNLTLYLINVDYLI